MTLAKCQRYSKILGCRLPITLNLVEQVTESNGVGFIQESQWYHTTLPHILVDHQGIEPCEPKRLVYSQPRLHSGLMIHITYSNMKPNRLSSGTPGRI